jgi:hypothetical protein
MKRSTIGASLFVIGAAAIFISSWLVMWWIWPIWHNTPASSFEGTIWAFGGPVFMAIALASPTGFLLLAIGAMLHAGPGGPTGGRLAALIGVAVLLWLSTLIAPTLSYVPVLFGVGGGLILLFFIVTLWQWANRRAALTGDTARAADLALAGLLCFFAAAPLLCALLGNPYSGLFFPERVIQDDALPWHYAMGTKILLFLVAGWAFMSASQWVARRGQV